MSNDTPSLLVNKETTQQIPLTDSYGTLLRKMHRAECFRAEQVYKLLDKRKDRSRADILRGCRNIAWFTRNLQTGEVHVASNACHLRWCPLCAAARRRYVSHSVASWLAKADHPKFLTLTLQHTSDSLYEQLEHLYKSFVELRRRKGFKAKITGGIWFLHIKRSKVDQLWHPHLHCLVTGMYISRRYLSRQWTQVTSGSCVIDIRAVNNSESAANDAAKYVSSPCRLDSVPLDDCLEIVEATHGRRTCGTWGVAHRLRLRPSPLLNKSSWENIGSWNTVVHMSQFDQNAKAIVLAWQTRTPLPSGIDCSSIDRFLAGEMEACLIGLDLNEFYEAEDEPP